MRARRARVCGAQNGWTLLHHAAETNSVAVARLLVKHGADVVAKTKGVRCLRE